MLELLRRVDGALVLWFFILAPVVAVAMPDKKRSEWEQLIAILKAIKSKL